MHENRETSGIPAVKPDTRTAGEGLGRTARMHISEESDSGTVPMNQSNKDEKLLAEIEEGRPLIEENTLQPNTRSTQSEASVSQGLSGVRKAARENKEMRFTSLLHHVSVDLLRASFRSLKRKAAPGVDGVTWQEYESGLEDHQADADRFLENLQARLRKFGLELHPDKTRLVEFGRYAEQNRKRRGEGKPETFDFLGFTHISGKNGKGHYTVRRTTVRKRMRKKLQEIKQQLRRRMHDPVPQTGGWLRSVLQGYFNYYALPGNLNTLGLFRDRVLRLWGKSLHRRSQKSRFTWVRRVALAEQWLPRPKKLHPYPEVRFAASHPR
jgi:hypothetical protein